MSAELFGNTACIFLPGWIGLIMLFGLSSREQRRFSHDITSWAVPFPPDLIVRLRAFSPVAISKKTGIYLDDVFDLMKGDRNRTCQEVIDKLETALKILEEEDERLEREAAKLCFTFRGLDAIEAREKERSRKELSDGKKGVNQS